MHRLTILRVTVIAIAAAQLGLGLAYTFAPAQFSAAIGLSTAPRWTAWPFAMMGARFLGFGYGMLLVLRRPLENRGWIQAMIGIQAIDWLATVTAVAAGAVTLRQVTTASFLPVLFIAGLVAGYPRRQANADAPAAAA